MSSKKQKKSSGKTIAVRESLKRTGPQLKEQLKPEMAFKLSPCGTLYLDSLLDPFDGPADACVPDWPSFPSQKVRAFSRGTLVVGSGGYGQLVARPSMANDVSAGWVSSASSWAGTSVATSAATGLSNVLLNGPFANAQVANSAGGIQVRPVSFGIRIRYSGTELNRGGTVYALEEPEHQDLGSLTTSGLMAYDRCHRFQVTDSQWTQICWAPIYPGEMDYSGTSLPTGLTGSSNTNYCMVLFVQSTAGNTFDYEVFINFEAIGSVIRSKTRSDTDTVGMEVVLGAMRTTNDGQIDRRMIQLSDNRKVRASQNQSVLKTVGNYALKQLSSIGPSLLKTAATYVAPMLLA